MYDTVNFWIDMANISGDNPFEILPYLSEIKEQQDEKSGYSCTGKAGDYLIYIAENGISLIGSLAKYHLGNNIDTLTLHSSKQAIERISDHLHTNIKKAKVTRLDVSTVIPTKRPPAEYYNYLGNKPYFERLQATKDTLYYNNHMRKVVFYDKTKETKNINISMPEIFENNNLFRYELRYTKRITKQLKQVVTGETLTDKVFYRNIIDNWYNEFKSIQKIKNHKIMIDDITSLKAAKETLFAYLLQEKGQSIIDEFLSELKTSKQFNNRSDYTKLKSDLNKMIVSKNGNKNELMQELEKKIFTYAKYAL